MVLGLLSCMYKFICPINCNNYQVSHTPKIYTIVQYNENTFVHILWICMYIIDILNLQIDIIIIIIIKRLLCLLKLLNIHL